MGALDGVKFWSLSKKNKYPSCKPKNTDLRGVALSDIDEEI